MALTKIESFDDLLFKIQTYEDEQGQRFPQLVHLLPENDQIFDIDLDSRTINIPQFLSVQYDHNAEIIYFKCPRYFENVDLATTVCIIEYVNADGEAGLYWVPYYNVDINYDINLSDNQKSEDLTPQMLIPWAVGGLATASAGTVTFTVRFYQLDAERKTFIFNMSMQPAYGEILHGIDLAEEDLAKFQLDTDVVTEIYQNLSLVQSEATTMWKDV